jgi:hypothetical protein
MSAPRWGHVAEWLRSGLQNRFGCPVLTPNIPKYPMLFRFLVCVIPRSTKLYLVVIWGWVPIAVPKEL